jgi:hypothetical protein
MTIEHGIIIGDHILPGTERVIRDSAAWWSEPSTDVYPRKGYRIDRLVGHWTGGHARTGPNAGRKLYQSMSGRKRDDGTPMDVSVHFGVSWDGLIWQMADLQSACIHVTRPINLRSIGVECMWPGTVTQAAKLGMADAVPIKGFARGGAVKACAPSADLLDAWRWLSDALTLAAHPLLTIPRQRGSMDRPGVLEHCDVDPGTKLDAAGLLVGALGWR